MKGFGIEIKNTLLDPKHVENMGNALWLYMFLVDKMTSITEEGFGLVLGGKPMKYEEIKEELGISQDTYTRWIDKLLEYPYIRITRTPYGIVFQVFKAHKHFGKRFRTSAESTSAVMRNHLRENAESNKTVSVDNNSKTDMRTKKTSAHKDFIDRFYRMVQIIRRVPKPIITGADAKNLQRVLKLGVLAPMELEQLALYFLAHYSFIQFSPTISTFLSAGVLNGLMNRAKNGETFWKDLDSYARRYKEIEMRKPEEKSDIARKVEELRKKLYATSTLAK